ncbi:MAG: helix-turn-helix transcriptional regulator [Acidimicrobiia bacterium]
MSTRATRDRASVLQVQARALGDPTRHEIFRYIAESDRPVDVAELTTHFQLNHNAIRQHLAKLVHADLVTEDQASSGRGRPRLVYRLDPTADSRWGVVGPYERLSTLLAEILRTGDAAIDVGRRSVRPTARGVVSDDDPVAIVVDVMAREGFEPDVRVSSGARVELVLRHCPFESAALADPTTVCELHLGLAEGAAAVSGDRIGVDELVPRDPRRANCRLRLHREPATSRSAGEST